MWAPGYYHRGSNHRSRRVIEDERLLAWAGTEEVHAANDHAYGCGRT